MFFYLFLQTVPVVTPLLLTTWHPKPLTLCNVHRLSTIRNTHSIAVIHEGQIVEQGSHQTLMSKVGGTYAQLISLQQHTGKKVTTTPTSLS